MDNIIEVALIGEEDMQMLIELSKIDKGICYALFSFIQQLLIDTLTNGAE